MSSFIEENMKEGWNDWLGLILRLIRLVVDRYSRKSSSLKELHQLRKDELDTARGEIIQLFVQSGQDDWREPVLVHEPTFLSVEFDAPYPNQSLGDSPSGYYIGTVSTSESDPFLQPSLENLLFRSSPPFSEDEDDNDLHLAEVSSNPEMGGCPWLESAFAQCVEELLLESSPSQLKDFETASDFAPTGGFAKHHRALDESSPFKVPKTIPRAVCPLKTIDEEPLLVTVEEPLTEVNGSHEFGRISPVNAEAASKLEADGEKHQSEAVEELNSGLKSDFEDPSNNANDSEESEVILPHQDPLPENDETEPQEQLSEIVSPVNNIKSGIPVVYPSSEKIRDTSSEEEEATDVLPVKRDSSTSIGFHRISNTLHTLIGNIQETPENHCCLINVKEYPRGTVPVTARKFGMRTTTENEDSDVIWLGWKSSFNNRIVAVRKYQNMRWYQRVNHFPGSWGLSFKDLLAKNLNHMIRHFPADYSFHPKTWFLPEDIAKVKSIARRYKDLYFIVKPKDLCAGEGIRLMRDFCKNFDSDMVCQLYIQRPFLIDGYKFDFRVYVLITSCIPLRVFVHNEGLARFATEKYQRPHFLNSRAKCMHLTNTSVNIRSPKYVQDEFSGTLRRMSTVFKWLKKNKHDVGKIQASMDDIIIKTIISNLPTFERYYRMCFPSDDNSNACFELMGFDIMLDHKLKLYLLEVNTNASLEITGSDQFEGEVKKSVMHDMFQILNLSESQRIKFSSQRKDETESRIEWELSHMGNFRKVYPPAAASRVLYYENIIEKAYLEPDRIK